MIRIPTPEPNSPAARALRMEGIPFVETWCREPTDYGNLFADLWDLGEPFVIVEHDLIPWPGAVDLLFACTRPWCTHRYPLAPGNVAKAWGIGKYVPEGPAAPTSWRESPWRLLDGEVVPVLLSLFGDSHVHEPPVAHARAELP